MANIRLLHVELEEVAQAMEEVGVTEMLSEFDEAKHRFNSPLDEDALIELLQRPWFKYAVSIHILLIADQLAAQTLLARAGGCP